MIIGTKVTNPGELRTQISLEPRTVSQDVGGFQTTGQGTAVLVWCRWTNVHGSEVWAAQAQQALRPATVVIRYLEGLDETWSVLKGTERYEIVSIDNIGERGEYQELKVQLAKEG
jgi:SPP1 family predicted phage head-tail adaptor